MAPTSLARPSTLATGPVPAIRPCLACLVLRPTHAMSASRRTNDSCTSPTRLATTRPTPLKTLNWYGASVHADLHPHPLTIRDRSSNISRQPLAHCQRPSLRDCTPKGAQGKSSRKPRVSAPFSIHSPMQAHESFLCRYMKLATLLDLSTLPACRLYYIDTGSCSFTLPMLATLPVLPRSFTPFTPIMTNTNHLCTLRPRFVSCTISLAVPPSLLQYHISTNSVSHPCPAVRRGGPSFHRIYSTLSPSIFL